MPNKPTYENDTCEELLDLSRANGQALILATAAFLQESDVPIEAWAHYLGRVFASSWDPLLELSAGDFLDAMLTNYRALGADVLSARLGEDVAEATITGFPKRELGLELRLESSLADSYFHVPSALAADHGLQWSWSVDGPRVRLLVSRSGN
ncbi:MAG: hypothetical protein AB7V46_06105 [Thermomicrobiales bacterium]